MLQALALAGLSAGGSLLSSMGAAQASAKQGRLQQINDNMARQRNNDILSEVNAKREALGRELLTIDETTTIEQMENSGSFVDVDGMMAAAERAGFNPATWLNAGGMQAYTHGWASSFNRTTRSGHNAAEAFKMMLPEYALAQASQAPQQHSMLSALGGALSAGTSAFGTQLRADQSFDLQSMKMMLAAGQQGMGLSDGNGFSQVIPARGSPISFPNTGVLSQPAGLPLAGGKDEGDKVWPSYEVAPLQMWENETPKVTNPFPPSWGWTIPPGYADAQAYEDAGAEIWSYPYSAIKLGNTILWNTTGNTAEGHFQQAKKDVAAWKSSAAYPPFYNATRYSGGAFSTGSMSP